MKPCEFPGWDELEGDDVVKRGDPLIYGHRLYGSPVYTPDQPQDKANSYAGRTISDLRTYESSGIRAFRRNPDAKNGARMRYPMNPQFSKPLPLP